jgi:hypothetical protein
MTVMTGLAQEGIDRTCNINIKLISTERGGLDRDREYGRSSEYIARNGRAQ